MIKNLKEKKATRIIQNNGMNTLSAQPQWFTLYLFISVFECCASVVDPLTGFNPIGFHIDLLIFILQWAENLIL